MYMYAATCRDVKKKIQNTSLLENDCYHFD